MNRRAAGPTVIGIALALLLCILVVPMLGAGRSPHILYRPNEIKTRFSDVRVSGGPPCTFRQRTY